MKQKASEHHLFKHVDKDSIQTSHRLYLGTRFSEKRSFYTQHLNYILKKRRKQCNTSSEMRSLAALTLAVLSRNVVINGNSLLPAMAMFLKYFTGKLNNAKSSTSSHCCLHKTVHLTIFFPSHHFLSPKIMSLLVLFSNITPSMVSPAHLHS